MERDGFASLWLGKIDSQDSLDEYAELVYTDSGEWLPSQFLADFKIEMDDFDEDFIENVCHESDAQTLAELITGCSYENVVLTRFINICGDKLQKGINCAILLYNFDYNGNVKDTKNNELSLKFIGTVEYR